MDDLEKSLSDRRPQVWLVGDASYPEFRDAVAELRQTARVTYFATARCVANDNTGKLPVPPEGLIGFSSPDVLVFAEPRPGKLSAAQIRAIRETHSLARSVRLMGSWCESRASSCRRETCIEQVMWHEFIPWWRSRVLRGPQLRRTGRGLIVINSPWRESADAIIDALAAEGFATLWLQRGRNLPKFGGAAAGIWDGGQFDPPERIPFLNFRWQLERDSAPLVALLDFPRHDRRDLAIELGAAAVLGKPVALENLSHVLYELTTQETRREIPVLPKAA